MCDIDGRPCFLGRSARSILAMGDWRFILLPVDNKCDDENNIDSRGMFGGWADARSIFAF